MSSSVLKKNRHESIWYDIEKLIVAEQDVWNDDDESNGGGGGGKCEKNGNRRGEMKSIRCEYMSLKMANSEHNCINW